MANKEHNPFVNMTLEQVADAEKRFYYIQVGDETVEYGGKQTFTKDKTDYLYGELLTNIRHMFRNGQPEERRSALIGLYNFRAIPLRIH